MSCSTCALTIGKYLEKKGLQNVKVSLASGDVSFESSGELDRQQIRQGIQDLGYTVVQEEAARAEPDVGRDAVSLLQDGLPLADRHDLVGGGKGEQIAKAPDAGLGHAPPGA